MTDIAAPGTALSTAPATAAVCPYLRGADGAWRSSSASRDHRCHAVAPPAPLATDKQRRLCLVAAHRGCSTFGAALEAHDEAGSVDDRLLHRPITRTAPLVLDRGRIAIAMPWLPDRGVGQGGLVALMVVAFGALAVTRSGGPEVVPSAVGSDASATPAAGTAATASPAPAASPTATPDPPDRTLVPSGGGSSAPPEATPEPPATTPAPTASTRPPTTYKVRSGDTLSGIAAEHGTTWQVLAELNELSDPRRLRVGQVIELP